MKYLVKHVWYIDLRSYFALSRLLIFLTCEKLWVRPKDPDTPQNLLLRQNIILRSQSAWNEKRILTSKDSWAFEDGIDQDASRERRIFGCPRRLQWSMIWVMKRRWSEPPSLQVAPWTYFYWNSRYKACGISAHISYNSLRKTCSKRSTLVLLRLCILFLSCHPFRIADSC